MLGCAKGKGVTISSLEMLKITLSASMRLAGYNTTRGFSVNKTSTTHGSIIIFMCLHNETYSIYNDTVKM